MSTITVNSKFDVLTSEQKAVAVAKDVLKNLKALRCVSGNTYIERPDLLPMKIKPEDSAQKHIEYFTKRCKVCALGACVISYVRLYNDVLVKDFRGYSIICDKLFPVFGRSMHTIEHAFEQGVGLKNHYDDDNQRLRAIMLNVVKNKGKFVPEV